MAADSPLSAQDAPWSADLSAFFRQRQRETLLMAVSGLAALGVLLLGSVPGFIDVSWGLAAGLALIFLCVAASLLLRWSFLGACVTLVVGSLLTTLAVVTWGELPPALVLLTIPVGLATLTIGAGTGLATALLSSLIVALAPWPQVSWALRAVTLVGVWYILGLIWLSLRPLLTAARWAWSGYERSLDLLREARDRQQTLHQTLEDLAAANVQLTRLNRLVDSLRQAAESARRVKEEFVSNVSHELRTPLNMIIGFSQMILEAPHAYGQVPRTLLADLAVIQRNSQHLSELVDDVLDLSQVDAGRMPLVRESVALPQVIDAAAIAVRPLFETKGLTLEIDSPPDLLVHCDPTRIREVVLNVLSNAGRFTERGGVSIRLERLSAEAQVSIADTGPGMAPQDVARLFEPFQQLDGTIKPRYGGSGLGLSISRRLIELHGGRMWIDSKVGAGTTVHFTLPLYLDQATEPGSLRWLSPEWEYTQRTDASLAPPVRLQPRYVVVEDGKALHRLLARHLGEVELAAVSSLAEAAAELAHSPAEALLINCASVPEMLQQLSATAALPAGVPAIICSVPCPASAADAQGATDYLVKPVSRDALLAALERVARPGASVLVVDDEQDAVQLFRRTLGACDRGYRVLTAGDGRRALALLREQRPDVLLVDLTMPELSGFELLALKNADPTLRDIPSVIISARDPAGSTIVADTVAAVRPGGLSGIDLLAAIKLLSRILGHGQSTDPTTPATADG